MRKGLLFTPNTLIKFAVKDETYIAGKGASETWQDIVYAIGSGETPATSDCYYCEWIDAFGNQSIAFQQLKVLQPARIRMAYNKKVYDALRSEVVKIYRNGLKEPQDTYKIYGNVDNYQNQNKWMEFSVQRYEGK